MTQEELTKALTEVQERSKSNTHRIDELAKVVETIHELATSTELLAVKLTNMQEDVTELTGKVNTLAETPGKRWELITSDVIKLVLAAFVGYALKSIGL
jgi:methyl-accepting chemotaxis protein